MPIKGHCDSPSRKSSSWSNTQAIPDELKRTRNLIKSICISLLKYGGDGHMPEGHITAGPVTVFRRSELSNWLVRNSRSSEFLLVLHLFYFFFFSFFFSELNTTHLLSIEVWLWVKVRLKVWVSITQAVITLLIFLGSFMAASVKIQMSCREAMRGPGWRANLQPCLSLSLTMLLLLTLPTVSNTH